MKTILFLSLAFLPLAAMADDIQRNCSSKDCKCTIEKHCGCFSGKGCNCGKRGHNNPDSFSE